VSVDKHITISPKSDGETILTNLQPEFPSHIQKQWEDSIMMLASIKRCS
jgi:hypothetical protein